MKARQMKVFTLAALACSSMVSCTSQIDIPRVDVSDDYIVFEAEATLSPLGSWALRTPEDPKYDIIVGDLPPINGSYIEYTAGKNDGLGIDAGVDSLQYTFTPKVSGTYRLTGRMAQQMQQPEPTKWDQCNDIYVKLAGDYTSGSTAPMEVLQQWTKFFGRGHQDEKCGKWGAFVQLDVNHEKFEAIYNLTAGKAYTLTISARSKGVAIDYFLLTRQAVDIEQQHDLASCNSERLRPRAIDAPAVDEQIYVATAFSKYTEMGDGYVDAQVDWNNDQVLSVADRLQWAAAETSFVGEDGAYDIELSTLLEADGESTFKLFIGDKLVGEVTNPRIYGSDLREYTVKSYKLTSEKIEVKKGDVLRVEFCSATNGLVPEGDTTATSRGRWLNVVLY